MNTMLLRQEVARPAKNTSYIHELFNQSEHILRQHRLENPDLYRLVEERKAMHLRRLMKRK